ncbi:mitochondrial potassium channel [Polymixia lowei]
MRYRGVQILPWSQGTCCLYRLSQSGSLSGRVRLVRTYSTQHQPGPPPPTNPTPPEEKGGAEVVKERALAVLQHVGELGKQWSQRTAKTTTATVNYWWGRYEEFVGLNEVRDAQAKVTEAEAAFMVARGMVREAHGSLETLQVRLKEVRDRLDRVSREDAHYLELATLEHKLLQEERRLRTAYENAEGSEREKFSLFSAGVRASHEKERTRAERTKNWSVIGSVLGALIGVMGSTYVNRVRLQELKTLLLEAQKGPESLQEALKVQAGNHRSQQDELGTLIDSLRVTLRDSAGDGRGRPDPASVTVGLTPAFASSHHEHMKELAASSQRAQTVLESLQPQLGQLEHGVGRLERELSAVKGLVEAAQQQPAREGPSESPPQWAETPEVVVKGLEETERRLGDQISRNMIYNIIFTFTAAALTVLLRGSG